MTFSSKIIEKYGGYVTIGNLVVFSFRITVSTEGSTYLIQGMPIPFFDGVSNSQSVMSISCNKSNSFTLLKNGSIYTSEVFSGENVMLSGCYIKE